MLPVYMQVFSYFQLFIIIIIILRFDRVASKLIKFREQQLNVILHSIIWILISLLLCL